MFFKMQKYHRFSLIIILSTTYSMFLSLKFHQFGRFFLLSISVFTGITLQKELHASPGLDNMS